MNNIIKYSAFRGNMNELESFLKDKEDIINRLVFNPSWTWKGDGKEAIYVDMFVADLYNSPISDDYYLRKNSEFFGRYKIQKTIGHWQREFFLEIGKISDELGLPHSSCLEISNGCFSYSRYANQKDITKLAREIENRFNLKTRIENTGRGHYKIYIHSDKSVLDSIIFLKGEPKPIKKKTDKESLKLAEKHLLKELAKIQKQLKDA